VDVLEMESSFGAILYDFGYLDAKLRTPGVPPALQRRTTGRSHFLACAVLNEVRDSDVVYATGEDVGFPVAALMRARRIPRPRLIVRLEQPMYGRTILRSAAYDMFRRYALQRIDKTLCRTTAHLHYLHSRNGVSITKLELLREPVDPIFFQPGFALGAAPANGAITSQPYLVSAGLEMRDYGTLFDAVRDLPVQVLVGAGSPWSREGFVRDALTPPPNVRVSCFSMEQMRELYRGAAFVVVPVRPTLRACGGNVVLEAGAMEKAVIATRTAGLLDYVAHGENGLFVDPFDPTELRDRIVHLLEHPTIAERLGQAGRRKVLSRHSLDRFVQRVEHLVCELMDPG
jgi:glycosyltransferase involved in cell wall biosynthesis